MVEPLKMVQEKGKRGLELQALELRLNKKEAPRESFGFHWGEGSAGPGSDTWHGRHTRNHNEEIFGDCGSHGGK